METGKRAVIRDETFSQATMKSATAALDFPSISAGLSADLTIALTGAAVGDIVFVVINDQWLLFRFDVFVG